MEAFKVAALTMTEITGTPKLLECPLPSRAPMMRCESYVPASVKDVDFSTYDPRFTGNASLWLQSETGEGAGGIISRDDSLCSIFQSLAEMDRYCRHNNRTHTTPQATTYNRVDALEGVPLVLTEEGEDHHSAVQRELLRKFQWIAHWAQLPFVFGIAITRNRLTIHTMHRDQPIMREIFTANLSDFYDRWRCVVAAVNIARTVLGFAAAGLTVPNPVRFGIWHERNAKRIRLGMHYMENEYESDEQYERMVEFYRATRAVPHLEAFYLCERAATEHALQTIRLVPVGVSRLPTTVAELVKCVQDICRALFALHALGYMHCDVKWSNIIEHFGDWYLIDCEYACSTADEPALLVDRSARIIRESHVMDTSKPWSPAHDLYQMGLLLLNTHALTSAHPALLALREKLLSKKFRIPSVRNLVNNL